jgi:outer membrane protein W
MIRRIAAVVVGIWVLAAPLSAQRFEASFNAGYTTSEGVKFAPVLIGAQLYDEVDLKDGGTFSLTAGVYASANALIEFMYARQSSELTARGGTGVNEQTVSKMNIDNYHVNFVYNFGEADAKMRPYAFVGLGATNYSPSGDVLVGGTGRQLDGNAQFSTTWGAGVKYYMAPAVGLKAGMRWTPTYIKSDPAGYWCDPFYGCWLLSDPDYSHQFEFSAGITFRF